MAYRQFWKGNSPTAAAAKAKIYPPGAPFLAKGAPGHDRMKIHAYANGFSVG